MSGARRTLVPALVYAALSTAVVSSLGMLLVPSIADEMGVTVSTAQWMLTVNLLAGAVATPVMGRLSDGAHTKRLLLVSLCVVLVGSLVAAVASSFGVFLVGRALQGLTYGIVPVTIALVRQHATPEQARPAISSLSVTVATGIGVGYPLTGLLAGTFHYRAAFWFAAAFVVTALAVVATLVPDDLSTDTAAPPFDVLGAALLGSGLGALLLGISEGSHWGWSSPGTLGMIAVAVVILTAWVRWELGRAHPLINLRTLRRPDVVLANGTAIALGGAMYIGLSVSSLVAQAPGSNGYGLGLSLLAAGFVMFPLSVGSFTANRVVRRVARRVDLAVLLPLGAGLMTFASVVLWLAHHSLPELLVGMFLFGIGMGTSYAAMPALIARSVATEELGSSVSFNQVLRTVGSSFGTAVSAAVIAAHLDARHQTTAAGISATFAVSAGVCVVVFLVLLVHAATKRGVSGRSRRPAPPPGR